MTIPASGALAASTIATEFSHATGPGSNIRLSEFIRNNNASYPNISSYVADITANAPIPQSTSGLSFSKYYSSQKGTIHRQTISADTTAYNQFSSAGGAIPIDSHVVINSGIFIYSTSTGTPAYTTGSAPGGSKLYLVNNGVISGKGGAGGAGASNVGSAGGLAATFATPISVNNASGTIGGGGGGGGGGANQSIDFPQPDAPTITNVYGGGGGGGGAGKSGGAGGAGQAADGPGSPGSGGSWNTGGAGGAGGYGGTYAGGAGGAAGAAGSAGAGGGGAGGAAGAATSGAPTYATFISVGTRSGTVG